MFQEIREDFITHGRSLKNGAFWALVVYRYGVWSLGQRFGPWRWLTSKVYGVFKILSEMTTGVRLQRETKIGQKFHIIHTGFVLIHPDVVIGDRVGIMHNVTLGTNMGPDVPTIGNDVFIGCGASILGKVTIGDGALIAANSLVIDDVPPGAVAIGVPAMVRPRGHRRAGEGHAQTEPPAK
jgi:serine O-acetyltransferase